MAKFSLGSLLLFLLISLLGCSSDSGGTGTVDPSPANITIQANIVGSSSATPNGDGSGVVNFIVKADNATSYKILLNSETISTNTGSFSYTFTQPGLNKYTVIASAYNGTKFVSKTIEITVLVSPKVVWSDEFNIDGAPDAAKWSFETGNNNGWGNNEVQYYTDRPENATVSNGTLKINLKKEPFQGFNYTSARMVSKDKYAFKYGKIEFRAKLAGGGGTWPALWMLGSNVTSAGWPQCGEIDVMEHVGNQLNRIHATLHYPERFGGNAIGSSTVISNATTEFHIYSMEWTATALKFYVDNQLFYTFANDASKPFNANFFIIMNVAMGGNFGGTVDPNVTAATMEVDYVRVYQ